MAGLGLAGGYGAGAASATLGDILKQKFLEQLQKQKLAEDIRQANMTNQIQQSQLGLSRDRLGLDTQELAQRGKQFDTTAGFKGREVTLEEQMQPVRIKQAGAQTAATEAQTNEILRKPVAEQQERDFTLTRDKNNYGNQASRDRAQHGYQMEEIGAQGDNALRVAGARLTDKPATPAERQALAFYNRAQESDKTLTTPDPSGKSLEQQIAAQGIVGQMQGAYAPNIAQTQNQQAYRQAQRAFTEARLRKESGAAIPPAEFESDQKTYFAQPGDSDAIIEQKRKARQTVLDGLRFAAGKAVGEFYGHEQGGGAAPAAGGGAPDAASHAAALIKKYGGG